MSTPVPLPALGESVTEGTISRWLKQVGDRVEMDEPLVEVSTDKVDTEIPSPVAGRAPRDPGPRGRRCAGRRSAGHHRRTGRGRRLRARSRCRTARCRIGARAEAAPVEAEEAAAEQAAPEPVPAPAEQDVPALQPPSTEKEPGTEAPAAGQAGGTDVVLPQLGESVTEGTISRWLKKVGDAVEADEPLVEVSTDKVDTEIPSPAAGVLLEIRVEEDATAPVGSVLAVIGAAVSAPAPSPGSRLRPPLRRRLRHRLRPPHRPRHPHRLHRAGTRCTRAGTEPRPDTRGLRPVPRARTAGRRGRLRDQLRHAAGAQDGRGQRHRPEHAQRHRRRRPHPQAGRPRCRGGGEGCCRGCRKAADEAARKAAEAPAPAPAAAAPAAAPAPAASGTDSGKRGTTEKMTRIRATIAKRMVESLQVSAQLTATVEVDLTAVSKLRAKEKDAFKAREGVGLSYLPFIAKAAVEALKQFPKVNATIDTEAGTITYADAEHLGIAVDTEKGLMVPVVKDAGDLSVSGLAKKIGDLAARSRSNKVTPDELGGGTFTITNYGSAGTLFDTPIINQPQVGILGTGALVKRPMVVKDPNLGEIVAVRDMMYLSMSYDHRLVDGAEAARFLSFVKARLEEGAFEL